MAVSSSKNAASCKDRTADQKKTKRKKNTEQFRTLTSTLLSLISLSTWSKTDCLVAPKHPWSLCLTLWHAAMSCYCLVCMVSRCFEWWQTVAQYCNMTRSQVPKLDQQVQGLQGGWEMFGMVTATGLSHGFPMRSFDSTSNTSERITKRDITWHFVIIMLQRGHKEGRRGGSSRIIKDLGFHIDMALCLASTRWLRPFFGSLTIWLQSRVPRVSECQRNWEELSKHIRKDLWNILNVLELCRTL